MVVVSWRGAVRLPHPQASLEGGTLNGAQRLYTDVDMRRPLAIAVGTEQRGLSQTWVDGADCRVRIPMLGQSDSLNVAAAAAVLLYEAVAQRRAVRAARRTT